MQEYKDQELLGSLTGELEQLTNRMQRRMSKGEITHATIGKLPYIGQVVEINGLKFTVFNVLSGSGKVFLQIKQAKGE